MGLFDFLKGGKSAKRSKGSSRKKKSSSSSSGKPTRAEKSALNKKLWAEKQAREKKGQSSSKPSRSSRSAKAEKPTSSTSDRRLSKAERSAANKKAWAEKAAKEKAKQASTESEPSTSTRSYGTLVTTTKLTKAEKSAANKKAWAEVRAQEAAERRLQREREKLARSSRGKRRSAFNSASEYGEYLKSEQWETKRQSTKERAQGKCEICGKSGSDVHHRRYRSPGNEKSSDLMYVCRSCHKRVHGT